MVKKASKAKAKTKTKAKAKSGAGKDALIRAVLSHVPFDGWSEAAIRAGAKDCKLNQAETARLLPNGAIDAVEAFIDLADREMIAGVKKMKPRPSGVSATVKAAILSRLEAVAEHRQAVASSIKLLARPQHAVLASKTLYRTTDRIWRLAGDKSVDFSFYTKRASLAGVYSATLLYWVANPSADDKQIEAFLDARLKEISLIPKLTAPMRKAAEAGSKMLGEILKRRPSSSSQ